MPEQVGALLAAYGICTPGSGTATGVKSALEMADRVGYPLALKLASHGITHKTDVGGVALNIQTPEQLRTEYDTMMQRVEDWESRAGSGEPDVRAELN